MIELFAFEVSLKIVGICFTVTTTFDATEFNCPSLTTKVKKYWVSWVTSGAVKVGMAAVTELSVIPAGAVQRCVIGCPKLPMILH